MGTKLRKRNPEKLIGKSKDGKDLVLMGEDYHYDGLIFKRKERKDRKGYFYYHVEEVPHVQVQPIPLFGYFIQTYEGENPSRCYVDLVKAFAFTSKEVRRNLKQVSS